MQLVAARLLYSMGRDGVIPQRLFGAVEPRRRIPRNNVLLLGALILVGALFVDYQLGTELLNFGALTAFMSVNAAAFLRHARRARSGARWRLVIPAFGLLVCLHLWLSLSIVAKLVGGGWMLLGAGYAAWRTDGFRRRIALSDLPPVSAP
jgi:amino acid transporter